MKPLIVASVLLLAACAGGGAGAPPPERGPTIVSLNPCTDAILAEVAAPGQLLAISHYSKDPRASSMEAAVAARFAATGGTVEEVLALDPCISEEFLKLYVAYKAETNFVDVVPQSKALRFSLNMRFADINDPRGLCKDVSGLGRWGNGEVEVKLENHTDLPYVMGLIRQSLERQLGNEVAA